MSFSGAPIGQLLDLLTGRTTTFVLDSRSTNFKFARTMMWLLGGSSDGCIVLDLDAFYSSNSDQIFTLPADAFSPTTIRAPELDSSIQSEAVRLFEAKQKVIVIDSLNTLYHLIAVDSANSRNRNLAFTIEALSYLARSNEKAVLLSMYRRTGFPRSDPGGSISNLSDSTVSVEVRDKELNLKKDRGRAWPSEAFSIRIP